MGGREEVCGNIFRAGHNRNGVNAERRIGSGALEVTLAPFGGSFAELGIER